MEVTVAKGKAEKRFIALSQGTDITIALADNSSAEIALLNNAPGGKNISSATVSLGKNSSLKLLQVNIGGGETSSNVEIIHNGEGSRCEHFEIGLLDGSQRLIARTNHLHKAKGTYSRSSFRHAAAGSALVDIEGKVTLSQKAEGGDAHFVAKSLLLSPNAIVKVIPMLYVRNSNVAAGHGAAMAPINADELFYMESRGIPDAAGKRMVLTGFLLEPAIAAKMDGKLLQKARAAIEEKAMRIFEGEENGI